MQRLAENSYIAEALVTCSEYQPFIDKMRERGSDHEPDHWTSYHFPLAAADEPILGVRQSDAVAFCAWLSGRDPEWKYRLPTSMEAEAFPLDTAAAEVGYWTFELDGGFGFTWARNAPAGENPLVIPEEYSRGSNRDIELAIRLTESLLEEIQSEKMRLPLLLKLNNFLTLRERIAGRSAAYEGIRLVQEHR